MNTKLALRMQGYSADDAGIICDRGAVRYAHERTGILKIQGPRAIVDAVIAAVDEPRAITGRDKFGGAVMLFRVEGGIHNVRHALQMRDSTDITITIGSEGSSVNVDSYTWPKSRSPLDVARDSLPRLFSDFAEIARQVVCAAGARPADEFTRERATEERLAQYGAGTLKTPTDEDLLTEHDAKLVKEWDGREASHMPSVLLARARHAERLAKVQAATDAVSQAEADRKLLARVESGELPDYLQRVIDARRRQGAAA